MMMSREFRQSQIVVSAVKMRSKNATPKILYKGLIYRQLRCCQVIGTRSIVGIALEHTHVCDRS
jgi:hypothetical protein